MGDLKPIGSEKLQGDDRMKRILELTYYGQKSSNQKTAKAELVKESTNGVYGIVKEKDGYYVKKGLNEGTLDYIGGLFMKNKNKFNSYAEALKRLELLKGQEQLNEDVKKYVLTTNKPKEETPMPAAPIDDVPAPAPTDSAPADDMGPEDVPSADDSASAAPAPDDSLPTDEPAAGEEEGKRSDYMAEIQKYAGKLGQELRDQQPKMESDDIKYVLNMIISAVDLDKLDEDDIEEIGKKFDRDEEETPEVGDEEPSAEEPAPDEEPAPEDDLGERITKLEELINSKLGSEEDQHEEELEEFYFFDDDDEKEMMQKLGKTSRFDTDDESMDADTDDEAMGVDTDPLADDEDEDDSYDLELNITPELGEINEAISTTLSKYFE